MRKLGFLCLACALLFAACQNIQINLVPTSGDTASDPSAAQSVMPDLSYAGYTRTNARSITDALTTVGGGAALATGDPIAAALIVKIDDMIRCYESVGAVAASIYTDANLGQLATGQIPKVGALAVVNRDRIARNLLSCALNTGQGFSAQADQPEPCAGTGTLVRSGETLDYIYAATDPELCALFAQSLQQ